jgi:TPR repeat protein
VKAACSERYKSIRDETILCRQELNTFIAANSIGVGKNIESCGLPIPHTPLFASEGKINSYREIKFLTPYNISNYVSQFNESKRNICMRLHQNNDFDGSFCLYILDGEKKETDSSYKYLGKAIELGHPLALMRPYQIFKDVKEQKDKEAIFNYLIQSAQLGNVAAAIDLGWIYIDKNPKNFQKGLFWSEFAANAGHGEGASNVGLIYHKGLGVKVDFNLAKYWYEKSLTMERYWSGQSQVGLGVLYMNGTGVPKDLNEARRLFRFVINEMPRASKDNINQATMNLKKLGS